MEDLVVSNGVTRDFWTGKRVLVTGHTGFKGTWLSLWLQSLGADVVGFALAPPSSPDMFTAVNLASDMRSIEGDVRDTQAIAATLAAHDPEIVLHLAAQSLVRPSYADPVATYATNVMGTVHLLDAIRRRPGRIRSVLNVTSDKCYENREWAWGYREADALGGHDPYSNSKGAAELVTAAFRASFFSGSSSQVALASARAGNVIGGGDWAQDRLIPDMVRAFEARRPVVIRHPSAVRPWQHVLEPLAGYLVLAQKLYTDGAAHAEAWNFGPSDNDARNVGSIVERLVQLWGDGASWQLDDEPQLHEAHLLRLDCSKARSRLKWQPRWDIEQALSRIIDWYRAHRDGQDMRAFSLQQIADFSKTDSR